jgi:hypothetical protein
VIVNNSTNINKTVSQQNSNRLLTITVLLILVELLTITVLLILVELLTITVLLILVELLTITVLLILVELLTHCFIDISWIIDSETESIIQLISIKQWVNNSTNINKTVIVNNSTNINKTVIVELLTITVLLILVELLTITVLLILVELLTHCFVDISWIVDSLFYWY